MKHPSPQTPTDAKAEREVKHIYKNFYDLPLYQDDAAAMLEKHNITKLIEYDRYCRDTLRFDEQKECYAEDSTVRITWYTGDGRDFVERSRQMSESKPSKHGTYSSPRHKIYNTFVWLQGKKAVAEAQCMMGGYNIVNDVEYHRLGWARLLYRVVKEAGVWKIKGMDCIYKRDMLLPVVPDPKAFVDPSAFENYRKSYKCVAWLFDHTGLPCGDELPGDDKPETLQKIYDEASEWFFSAEN